MNKEFIPSDMCSEVVVVEASAGSGKTYALAKRYLKLLINPTLSKNQIPLRNILAITFTNKATVEMKGRILEFLKRIAFDDFKNPAEKEDILNYLEVTFEFAQKKSYLAMDELIRHYSFFQVKTIDSFVNTLLLGCSLRIDRSASFDIKRDYNEYLLYCLDLVIDAASTNKEMLKLLNDFLKHYLFVENQKGWFPKDDILKLMKSFFNLTNKYGCDFIEYPEDSYNVLEKKRVLFKQIKDFSILDLSDLNKRVVKAISSFLKKDHQGFLVKDLPLAFSSLNPPVNKGKTFPQDYVAKWGKINFSIKEIVRLEAFSSYNPYIRLFRYLIYFFGQISRKEDILFLEELNNKALSLFGDDGITVAELYYRLASRFRHYLIDEFQDTSVLQWNNLYSMIEEGLSTGGTLFYVGDKKQAIYRFRGGEVELFDQVQKSFSQFKILPESLKVNWRSCKTIVDFNNLVFSKTNLMSGLDLSGITSEFKNSTGLSENILDVFAGSEQVSRPEAMGGYVKVKRIEAKTMLERDELIKPEVISLVKDLKEKRGFDYEDIAVLARDNNEVELLTSWLFDASIPVESDKTLNVLKHQLIKELISFLRFLNSPIDDLSFASFILGDIFTSISGKEYDEITDFLFLVRTQPKSKSLYRKFKDKYPKTWSKFIYDFFASVGFVSYYELVSSIYQKFDLFKNFPSGHAFFMKFLELMKDKEAEHLGLNEFLAYLDDAPKDDLYINVTHKNSVKILTIHKSKGLEFDIVVIPFLRMDITAETGGRGTRSHFDLENNRLVRIISPYRSFLSELQDIYEQDYKKACIDELNNIYVALTRPRQELHVFVPKRSGNQNNKAWFLFEGLEGEFGDKIKLKREDKKSEKEFLKISPIKNANWTSSLSGEFITDYSIRNRLNLLRGNILHSMLSTVGNCISFDSGDLINVALIKAKSVISYPLDLNEELEVFKQIISSQDLRKFFYLKEALCYCEKEITNQWGDLKRIDRLIVFKSEVWVIDYKSSQQDDLSQKEQIIEYMNIIKLIFPKHKTRAFIVFFDSCEAKELDEAGNYL